jgi:hypothetical protein
MKIHSYMMQSSIELRKIKTLVVYEERERKKIPC